MLVKARRKNLHLQKLRKYLQATGWRFSHLKISQSVLSHSILTCWNRQCWPNLQYPNLKCLHATVCTSIFICERQLLIKTIFFFLSASCVLCYNHLNHSFRYSKWELFLGRQIGITIITIFQVSDFCFLNSYCKFIFSEGKEGMFSLNEGTEGMFIFKWRQRRHAL